MPPKKMYQNLKKIRRIRSLNSSIPEQHPMPDPEEEIPAEEPLYIPEEEIQEERPIGTEQPPQFRNNGFYGAAAAYIPKYAGTFQPLVVDDEEPEDDVEAFVNPDIANPIDNTEASQLRTMATKFTTQKPQHQ